MFMWGGITTEYSSPVDPSVVECFNVLSLSWEQPSRRLLNHKVIPAGYCKMAVASDGENSYLFGGSDIESVSAEDPFNEIYEVHMPSLKCKKLVPAADSDSLFTPGNALVCVNRTLISYGGVEVDSANPMPTLSEKLFVFDLIKSE